MKFDESKVINGLHSDRATIGQFYHFKDDITVLKEIVEDGIDILKLVDFEDGYFYTSSGSRFLLAYPAPNPFDESKVINMLHANKAEVGKEYYYASEIVSLKNRVENHSMYHGTLEGVGTKNQGNAFALHDYDGRISFGYLLYPLS